MGLADGTHAYIRMCVDGSLKTCETASDVRCCVVVAVVGTKGVWSVKFFFFFWEWRMEDFFFSLRWYGGRDFCCS